MKLFISSNSFLSFLFLFLFLFSFETVKLTYTSDTEIGRNNEDNVNNIEQNIEQITNKPKSEKISNSKRISSKHSSIKDHGKRKIYSNNRHHQMNQVYNGMGNTPPYSSQSSKSNIISNVTPNNKNSHSFLSNFYQIAMFIFFTSLAVNFLFGGKRNDNSAYRWMEINKEYLLENYEKLGLIYDEKTGEYSENEDKRTKDLYLIKSSSNLYKLVCYKSKYIQYLSVFLEFKKKFDVPTMVVNLVKRSNDKIIYHVTFRPVENFSWIFCLCSRKDALKIKSAYEDLNTLTSIYQPNFLSSDKCLLSENLDLFNNFLENNRELYRAYKAIEFFLETIYCSYQVSFDNQDINIFFSFDVNLSDKMQVRIFLEITQFVNLFVNSLAQIKYTKELKHEILTNRKLYSEEEINRLLNPIVQKNNNNNNNGNKKKKIKKKGGQNNQKNNGKNQNNKNNGNQGNKNQKNKNSYNIKTLTKMKK